MVAVDKELALKGIPAALRSFHAYFSISGAKSMRGHTNFDPSLGLYEGTNLFLSIDEWYVATYPRRVISARDFGARPVLIRSELFLMQIPAAPNANPETMSAMKYIEGICGSLVQILDQNEKDDIQARFNLYFREGSRLALLGVRTKEFSGPNAPLAAALIAHGLADLHSVSRSILQSQPSAHLWSAQQAVEKLLKAYLSLCDPAMNVAKLKRTFGHNLSFLLKECAKHCAAFQQASQDIARVNINPEERYQGAVVAVGDVLAAIDTAYAICDLTARVIFAMLKERR